MHIGNLRTLADFVEFPSQFVHYLKKRMKVPVYVYASDELDYFGCYLISNLEIPIPPAAQSIDRVLIVNATSDFDLYFSYKRGLGPRVVRPSQFIPRHLKSILLTLEKTRPPGYTDIICSLLDIDYSFRRGIEQNIVSALQRSREGNGVVRDCTVINTLDRWGFTYFCGNSQLPTNIERLLFLPEYCMHKMTQSNIYSWIGLARDTSSRRAFVSVFYSGKRDSSSQTSNDDLLQI